MRMLCQSNRSCTMDRHIVSLLLLALTVETGCSTENRFFISAPNVFHVGVGEKVFVQMGKQHHNTPVTLYLEHESTGTVMSSKETVICTEKKDFETVELKINSKIMSELPPPKYPPFYLLVVAESRTISNRIFIKVLVSKHRGYIFIQTNQPAYNPNQQVYYRIFTLDHMLRPHGDILHTSVFNAAGNRIQKSIKSAKDGIIKDKFPIPDVSEMGTWKISAHFEGDDANAVSRELKVQRFVLPSFGVDIKLEQKYILLSAKHVVFTISATYTHGEKVKGAYYCKFGMGLKPQSRNEKTRPVFIKGLELTGSVQNGQATVSLPIAKLNDQLQEEKNLTLAGLQERGAQIYLAVFVTDIESGEMQEADAHLPVLSHKYTMDLSRTRSYLPPGFPLDVVVIVRHPDGSPASGVPVRAVIQGSSEQGITDQEGAMFHTFNIDSTAPVTVEVTADDLQQKKAIRRTLSSSASYLYISFTPRMYSVDDFLSVTYNTLNGPNNRFIYYMVLSRGILIKSGRLSFGSSIKDNLLITHDMVPSFRLIGYFYNEHGDVISDSVWVDVRDECEIKVKVDLKGPFEPGKQSVLDIDLHGQKATVALLAVDKAFYALNTDNKLTAKQVFSAMQSYDLGCSYGGGRDSVSGLKDAGLSFVTHSQSGWKNDSRCDSRSSRKKRSVDLNQEMMIFKSNFSKLESECCDHGFSLIPMTLTCQQRAKRMSLVKPRNQACADIFLKCCLEAQRLRQKNIQEAEKGLGRTSSVEEFFLDPTNQYIRQIFLPSIAFNEIEVNGKKRYSLALPDSITTWELQIITLSAATGFCVVKPTEVKAVKRTFVSLRLPYSVKIYEQMFISPVIYNYGQDDLEVAVHMEQTEGLCSPGSATTAAFVNITVKSESSAFVSFSAAPMVSGQIPIKIRLYDIINERGIDAIEKSLNVLAEGLEQRDWQTRVIKLDGKSVKTIAIDGSFPHETIPNSGANIFISAEENEFKTQAKNLLSVEKVAKLIVLPKGCLEQTMTGLAPTASALRYLDLSEQWFNLPTGKRDEALKNIMQGITRILSYKNADGSYGAFNSVPSSNWVTALVVKVMSLVAQRQRGGLGEQGLKTTLSQEDISLSVRYLLSVQQTDGSFIDPHPVLHRDVLKGKDQVASMTAFITVSLHLSLDFLPEDTEIAVNASISRSTSYLMLHLEKLQHPYAIATTAYCLSVCLQEVTSVTRAWTKLQALATEGNDGCYLWTTDNSPLNQGKADSITIETTAYALLTAVALQDRQWADKAACWLITQENYFGGYASSQDTLMALEALAEYELKKPVYPASNIIAEFTVPHKAEIVKLVLENKMIVETNLKKFVGSQINMELSGKGNAKVKIVKVYHLLGPKDHCTKLSISVTVTGKVKYTPKVIENYEYYDDYDINMGKEPIPPQLGTEESDSHDRKRRDVVDNLSSVKTVTYRVCVSHSLNYSLSGMAIADITLLSGFEVVISDLDKLKQTPEQYIAHYEVHHGRLLIYFNELFESEECIDFDAKQTVPIGLLQPAPAVFYDYYEPNQRCTVFYSAPQRSKLVSKLCSEDVCQCAERPCHKPKMTFKSERNVGLTKNDRLQHACFYPVVDYGYIVEVLGVSVASNFEIYNSRVIKVLRSHGDHFVKANSVRMFVMRRQCKGALNLGREYLIMGKDGSTTDSTGAMQYLLESNTWIEQKPTDDECKKTTHQIACRGFFTFIKEYKVDGCSQ